MALKRGRTVSRAGSLLSYTEMECYSTTDAVNDWTDGWMDEWLTDWSTKWMNGEEDGRTDAWI